jgi:PGF-CTERM protein
VRARNVKQIEQQYRCKRTKKWRIKNPPFNFFYFDKNKEVNVTKGKMKMDTNRTVVVFIAVLVLLAMPATAAAVSVTRDFRPDAVSPGGEFNVSLTQSGFFSLGEGGVGTVIEALPEGFKFRGLLVGDGDYDYDEPTNNLTIEFRGETTITYVVKAGTEEQIENAVFYGTYKTTDTGLNVKTGDIEGDTRLTLAVPTPTPTPTEAPPSGDGGGAGGGAGGGPPPSPPVGESAYIHLNATLAEIPADGVSTSAITAFVWDGEEWVMENLTVNFSTSLGNITASVPIVNESAIAILTAGTEEGIANVTAEANLSGDIGVVNATTTVNFTTPPEATPTPTETPGVTATPTPMATAAETPTPTVSPTGGIPGFEGIFAVAGLLAVAYLVMRRRRR